MDCPICSFEVANIRGLASHFRHQAGTHPDYKQWQEDQRWDGKVEDEDYVRCLECGHRAATLARHLKAAHGISADVYRAKHGAVLIRPSKVTLKRRAAIKRGRAASNAYEGTKVILCPSCGCEHIVHKLSGIVPCSKCKEQKRISRWDGKTEPQDSLTCLDCGYRAENLTSHFQNAHPGYRARHPGALVVALGSAVRNKTALVGRELSAETRQLMSKNAGRWNKGLTKETDASLARMSQKLLGRPSWSKGLTAAVDPRLANTARKLRMYVGADRPWDNGLAANLTMEDFKPFMDVDGRVDHHKVIEATGISWVTVRKYIVDLGLVQSRKYIEDAADNRTIRLDKKVLEQFKLGNGKVSIGKAMSVTGHAFKVIKRECLRHNLPTFHRRIRQTICIEALKEALGGLPYEMEWKSWRFTNPSTGYRFRFDALFPDVGLVAEFQGFQHYTFPNAFMRDDSYLSVYEAQLGRDRLKRELIEAADDLIFMEVREDEPYADPMYLRGRLHQLGLTGLTPSEPLNKVPAKCDFTPVRTPCNTV